jgi:hypothetical protein
MRERWRGSGARWQDGGGSPETSPATHKHGFPSTKLDGESTKMKRAHEGFNELLAPASWAAEKAPLRPRRTAEVRRAALGAREVQGIKERGG